MFIIYSNSNEVIITTLEKESETIRLFFIMGGRNVDDYDRSESEDVAVAIESRLSVD